MFEPERIDRIATLFKETSKAHHEAFAATDGADPDWPHWYALHLEEPLNEILGSGLSPAQIATLLMEVEQEHLITSPGREWPGYYAEFFIARAM